MKRVAKFFIVCVLLFVGSSIVMAVEIKGTVVQTAGLDVTVKIGGQSLPVSGDLMEISFSIPGGDALSIGTWKVTSVSGHFVSASVVENTGTPAKGQLAVITSNSPVPVKQAVERNQPALVSPPVVNHQVSSQAQEVISLLHSSDPVQIRNGAKRAYRNFATDEAVVAIAAEVLEQKYADSPRNKYHVDAMSWLCNALGASKDMKYKELLTLVARKSPSKKIRKYAKKNLRYMR